MKIVIISDTHGMHDHLPDHLPEGDVLIHAGDCTNVGTQSGTRQFVEWFQNLKGYDTKIFIAGNHDWSFYRKPAWLYDFINDENLSQSDCVYLEDSEFTIETPEFSRPIKFYGSPWQPPFMNWAFNAPEEQLFKIWEKIPDDTDVLITHGPANGVLDTVIGRYEHLGSTTLTERINKIKPKIHICGHIHSGRGIIEKDGVLYINASTATEEYDMTNKPIVLEYDFNNGNYNIIDI
jgi:Icc-related predicted phosphoesterase